MKNKKGFTMVELLAVIAILAILVILVLPNVLERFREAKRSSFATEIKTIYDAAQKEYMNNVFSGNTGKNITMCNVASCTKHVELSGGNNVDYAIKLNPKGEVICYQVTNGSFYYIAERRIEDVNDIDEAEIIDVSQNDGVNITPTCSQSINIEDIKKIKVLNIYPDLKSGYLSVGSAMTGNFVSSVDKKTYNLMKSASLKKWMEESNSDSSNGYGKGIINVDVMSYTEFNSNPTKADKYDLIFIGTWDGNARVSLSDIGQAYIKEWIEDERPIIIGHDVLFHADNTAVNPTSAKFNELRSYFNIKLNTYDKEVSKNKACSIQVTKTKISQAGIFTTYPWAIGEVGTVLDIPRTHTSGQVAYGDVWLTMDTNYKTDDNGNGVANYYLTSWKNTAMIQTGHSNCSATKEEQKIIANIIFYMYYTYVVSNDEE